jgi:hypothetical protein
MLLPHFVVIEIYLRKDADDAQAGIPTTPRTTGAVSASALAPSVDAASIEPVFQASKPELRSKSGHK